MYHFRRVSIVIVLNVGVKCYVISKVERYEVPLRTAS